jgi:hypothetical protein
MCGSPAKRVNSCHHDEAYFVCKKTLPKSSILLLIFTKAIMAHTNTYNIAILPEIFFFSQ